MPEEKRIHCGLCNELVADWKKHTNSKEHKANIANPALVQERTLEHMLELERSMKGEGNGKPSGG